MPKFCLTISTTGAKQFVVHEAFEIILSFLFILFSFTPKTIVFTSLSPLLRGVRGVFFAGDEIITFLAPAFMCSPASCFVLNLPVHSKTISTCISRQGNLLGSFSASTLYFLPATIKLSAVYSTFLPYLP